MAYSSAKKPFRSVNDFYREKFGAKVFRIPVNAGFSCPNRDGSLGYSGCSFCTEAAAGEFAGRAEAALATQYAEISAVMRKKWPQGQTIVYFQANTNTYAPLAYLQHLYETALSLDKSVVGIAIATRPDCLDREIVGYLEELNRRTFVTVELGLQTIHEKTATSINRGYPLAVFDGAIRQLAAAGIHPVAHIINGLPGEDEAMMLETVRHLNELPVAGVKIHMLYLTETAPLGMIYRKEPFPLLTQEDYCGIATRQLEIMRPDMIIYRLTGDPPKASLIAPAWSSHKFAVIKAITGILRQRCSFQGKEYVPAVSRKQ